MIDETRGTDVGMLLLSLLLLLLFFLKQLIIFILFAYGPVELSLHVSLAVGLFGSICNPVIN